MLNLGGYVILKTVNQIAKEYDVSRQAVYKRLNRLSTRLTPCLHKDKDGITVIDEDGERILTEIWKKRTVNHDNQSSQLKQKVDSKPVNQLNDFLYEQIRIKDQLINDLLSQQKDLIEKINNFQVLLQNEQIKSLPQNKDNDKDQEIKKNLFQRLFSRNR